MAIIIYACEPQDEGEYIVKEFAHILAHNLVELIALLK